MQGTAPGHRHRAFERAKSSVTEASERCRPAWVNQTARSLPPERRCAVRGPARSVVDPARDGDRSACAGELGGEAYGTLEGAERIARDADRTDESATRPGKLKRRIDPEPDVEDEDIFRITPGEPRP